MPRLLSGRVATQYDTLPADNDIFLATSGAEPYLGVPVSDNSLVFFDSDGVRRFDVPPVFLPGNQIQAQQTNEDIEIYHVFVDAIGTNSRFLADTGVRYNPFLDTMYIDEDLVVGNDLSVGNNVSVVGTVTSTSDARVKDNIQPIDNALKKVSSLGGYSFTRKDLEGNPTQYGAIAQEVKEMFPDLVKEDEKGMLSVDYIGLIAVLIEAVKELNSKVG